MPVKRQDILPLLEDLFEKCLIVEATYEQAAFAASDHAQKTRCLFLWQERAEAARELREMIHRLGGTSHPMPIPGVEARRHWSGRLNSREQAGLLAEAVEGDEAMRAEYDLILHHALPIDVQMLLMRHRLKLKANEKAGLLDQLVQNSLHRDILAQAGYN